MYLMFVSDLCCFQDRKTKESQGFTRAKKRSKGIEDPALPPILDHAGPDAEHVADAPALPGKKSRASASQKKAPAKK